MCVISLPSLDELCVNGINLLTTLGTNFPFVYWANAEASIILTNTITTNFILSNIFL